MNDAADGAGPPTYLILLRHVLVAQDIAMTVAEFDPGARVITAVTGQEAMTQLADVDRIALAFIGKGPGTFRGSPLARALAERGGQVVLMGEEAEADGEAQGFRVLERPFSTGNIMAQLIRGSR